MIPPRRTAPPAFSFNLLRSMADERTTSFDPLFSEFPPVSDDEWRERIERDLRGKDPDRVLTWHSVDGVDLRAFYRESDRASIQHDDALPLLDPDAEPANKWRTRQDISASDFGAAREQLTGALEGGATDVGLRLSVENGEVHGVPIQQQTDLDRLLDSIDLSETGVHLAADAASPHLLAMLLNYAEAHNALDALHGSVEYDPAAALALHTQTDAPQAYDTAAELLGLAATHPDLRTLSVDLRPYHYAGGSAVQALGMALGACTELLAQCTERGHTPEDVAPTLQIIAPVDTSFFVGLSSLRALRLLVPQIFGAYDVDLAPEEVFIQAQTSRRAWSAYDAHTNMVRASSQAAAAVMGGCDVLTVHPYDIANAKGATPSDLGERIARNTSLILKHESHLDAVADPGAGAYYIEQMTDQLAERAWATFQSIEEKGGWLTALQTGFLQAQLADTRAERASQIATRRRVIVGLNQYPNVEASSASRPDESGIPLQTTDAAPEGRSISDLRAAFRNGGALGDVLATHSDALPDWDALPQGRTTEAVETLRQRTEQHADQTGDTPTIFLLPFGEPAMRSARANFARNFFGVAGFDIEEPLRFETVADGAQAAIEADADAIVLCSSDAAYAEAVPALRTELDDASHSALIVVAGYPEDEIDALRTAGADAFIYRRSPLLDTLADYQKQFGIT